MALSLQILQRRRRRNAAAASAAAAAFLALAAVFTVFFAPRNDGGANEIGIFSSSSPDSSPGACREMQSLDDHGARCRYVRTHTPCAPEGYVDYLRMLYCGFGREPGLGYAVLALWLLVLFYLLGDTASEYFCASLEGLSSVLRLPPAIAGVTLLSLGNGAPDVLSSVVAFAAGGEEAGDVGLSGVLGGALFVSTVVAGVVAIVAGSRGHVTIEQRGFVRDVCFLLVALCYLLAVLLTGAVTVWASASFLSLYAGYVLLVWTSHCCADPSAEEEATIRQPSSSLAAPLLLLLDDDASPPPLPVSSKQPAAPRTFARRLVDLLHSPLYLPRRLTIPDIAAHRWSKPNAVASALLYPLLLVAITAPPTSTTPILLFSAALAGVILAAAAALTTDAASPPKSRWARLPWLAGGFLMSVLWSYVLARELVSLLVSIGVAAGVESGVLGATVLAWGNSLGDLVADVALAMHGGAETAVAGCYAGPAFNTVVGIGLSLTLAAGARHQEQYAIPAGVAVYVALGFLAAALVWALVVLPARGMRLDAVLGVGLLVIYFVFLCVRLAILTPLH